MFNRRDKEQQHTHAHGKSEDLFFGRTARINYKWLWLFLSLLVVSASSGPEKQAAIEKQQRWEIDNGLERGFRYGK
jgi:hypothetical protein